MILRLSLARLASVALCCAALSGVAAAQDFRGAIAGTVTDSTGAVLPGATVVITNVETNVAQEVITNSEGRYQARYLNSGTYSVTARLPGFRSVVRRGIEVRVGDVLNVDVTLDTGVVEEVVEVVAETPVLNTSSGVSGQVIDSTMIQQLPLGDGTAYMLTRLAPGVADTSDLHFSRPMDNGNLAGVVTNGARGGNEFTLDGAPNRVSPNNTSAGNNSGVVGFSPPSDAISEFKVQTNAFDAQSGHTAGATVNLALRSGTNDFRGTASYFNRDDSRSAVPLLTKRANGEKPTREYNRYTATFAGPVIKDRTFFMVAYEHLRDVQPEPAFYTVPTLRMRQGDLSEYTNVTVYDPRTGGSGNRAAFPGNVIPSDRLNPIALAYASYYPEPNRPGLEDNYFTNQLRPYDYDAVLGRVDHNFSDSMRLFVTGYWNKRREDRYNWALGAANATGEGEINGFLVTQGFDFRSNTGATAGFTSSVNSRMVLDVRAAWARFGEWRQPAEDFDPAQLGFSGQTIGLMNGYSYLPFITFGGFSTTNSNSRIATLGSQRADFGSGFDRPFTNISFVPTVTRLWGEHTMRAGYDLRHRRWDIDSAPYGAGRYHFNGAYTRLNNSAPQNDPAQSWAQFLLGLPTSGTGTVANPGSTASQFEIAAVGNYRQTSHGLFVQDDWRVNRRLTLNLGLRLEVDMPLTEAGNRNLAGFDPEAASPIEAAALANYARNPIAQIPAGSFRVRGGVRFAEGGLYNTLVKPLPRAFASYLLNDRTVLRGGLGLFSFPYYFDAGNQTGFSQPTGIVTTTNNGQTFLTDLNNPIPSGSLIQPVGASAGLATGLGLGLGTVVPSHREAPYYTRWQAGVQRDLGQGWMVELTYLGSRGSNLPVLRDINALPVQYRSTSRTRDTAHEAFLAEQVPNPFQGMLPGTAFNGATIPRMQLLRPHPQFQSIITEEYVGSDRYHAGSIVLQKQFGNGNSLLASYTRSRLRDRLFYLNPGELEDRVSPDDRPNRLTVAGTYRVPFGSGQRWGSDWSGVRQAVLGGWQVSANYQYQTGFPLTWGVSNNIAGTSIFYDPSRDPRELRGNIGEDTDCGVAGLDCAAWDTSGFFLPGGGRTDPNIQLGNNVRYFPSTLPDVRTHDLHLLDVGLYKTFTLPRDVRLQVRAEAINALNYTVLWNPNVDPRNANFGLINTDRNNPRDIQLGLRLTF